MGNKQGVFTKEKLEELQDCTYFSGRKIKRLYKKFAMINPQRIDQKIADFDTKLAACNLINACIIKSDHYLFCKIDFFSYSKFTRDERKSVQG